MRPAGYSPYELVSDPAAFDLATTTVRGALGSCVARHPVTRSSRRATIFLHGAAGSWTTWTPLLLAARDEDIELGDTVLLDLPGWGEAELGDLDGSHTIEAICGLVKQVAEVLGYTEWDLVGHSLGGFVALHMAAIWPQSVLSVGMVSGTTFSVIHSVEHPFRRFLELPSFTMLWRVMQFLAAIGPAGRAMVRGMSRLGLLRIATSPLFRHWTRIPRSQVRALAWELRPRAFVAAAAVARGYDAAGMWSRVECPVRALKGDHDAFVTAQDLVDLAELVEGAVTVVIDDCGHFGALEQPSAVLAALGYGPGAGPGLR